MFRAVSEMTAPVKTSSLCARPFYFICGQRPRRLVSARAHTLALISVKVDWHRIAESRSIAHSAYVRRKIKLTSRVRQTMQIAPCPKTLFVLAKKIHLVRRERPRAIVGRSLRPIALCRPLFSLAAYFHTHCC
jgi:hypothetical protein